MISAEQVRYWIGKSVFGALDTAVSARLLPVRFPKGLHLEYDLQRALNSPVTTIIDGGANVGETTMRFCRFFSEATVHAFEPVDATFQVLEKRAQGHQRIRCQRLALGEREEELRIILSADSEMNSLLNSADTGDPHPAATVQVVRLDQYAEAQRIEKIDVLKLDLEGYEMLALRGAAHLLARGAIRAIYSECGFVSKDRCKTPFGKLHEEIETHGFLFAGFYQTFRWGPDKRWAGFSNGLWLHS